MAVGATMKQHTMGQSPLATALQTMTNDSRFDHGPDSKGLQSDPAQRAQLVLWQRRSILLDLGSLVP
jgi:hypothetical protein